jgi:GNAT superfamily N-acetyltransferase
VTLTTPRTSTDTVDPAVEQLAVDVAVDEAEQLEQLVNGLDGTETRDTTTGDGQATVRRLTDADLHRCSELGLSRDWGAEQRKWGLLFELGEVYGIEDEAGRLIATAVLTRYGQQFGSVSMVLVAQSHERRGLGTRIVRHVLDQASSSTLVLHATPEGRPLYERLGFKPFGTVEAHVGVFDPTGARAGRTQPASAQDLLQLARLDREVYGVHRTALLKRLPDFAERVRVLRNEEGLITGYGALWRSEELAAIGPVLAPDVAGARDLITDLAEGVEDRLRLDVDAEGDDLSAWACGHGLKPAYTCTHMVLGDGPVPMDQLRLHAPMMCALG